MEINIFPIIHRCDLFREREARIQCEFGTSLFPGPHCWVPFLKRLTSKAILNHSSCQGLIFLCCILQCCGSVSFWCRSGLLCHKFLEKSLLYQPFHYLGISPDRHAVDADPDPNPVNDADPTESGSGCTTMTFSLVPVIVYQGNNLFSFLEKYCRSDGFRYYAVSGFASLAWPTDFVGIRIRIPNVNRGMLQMPRWIILCAIADLNNFRTCRIRTRDRMRILFTSTKRGSFLDEGTRSLK